MSDIAYKHRPVMLDECVDALNIKDGGAYLDCTLGGGGHSSAILERLSGGLLAGIDRDGAAIDAATARINDARFLPIRGNFHDAAALLAAHGIEGVDGALIDLGVSSNQLDDGGRGFSYHQDAPLDMRMDTSQELTAAVVVNTYPRERLTKIIRDYGEENWAAQIAKVICDRREADPILTTGQLVGIIDAAIPKKLRAAAGGAHPARRTFQALRIEVNDELAPLEAAVRDLAENLLAPGGRLAVITFHSLEDRIIKNTFRDLANPCTCPRDFPVCVCGKKPVVKIITRKPVTASPDELAANNRARSARLRVAERLGEGI